MRLSGFPDDWKLNAATQNNVLVDDDGRPLICDFGRSRVLEQSGFTTVFAAGAARYMAPELFGPDDADIESANSFVPVLTKESDVYSFAMVCVEVGSFYSDWFTPSRNLTLHSDPFWKSTIPPNQA